jgi:predicted TIM-barrel fold metal-dependent hydrolase
MSIGATKMDMATARRIDAPAAAGIYDTHFHVFGPYDRFPLPHDPSYRPKEAPVAAYSDVASRLGIDRMVVVQGGCYGADNSAMLAAVQSLGPDRASGIAVIDGATSVADLRRLDEGGVRGIRINVMSDKGIDADAIRARANMIAELGWHIQFHAGADQIVQHAALLRDLPVDVVIDHCGRIDPREGEDQAAMRAMLDLLETGRGWIKLISYRSLPPGGRGDEMVPFLRRFAAAAPERCLWGTDWPHPLMANEPDTQTLLDEFSGVFDGEPLRGAILSRNAEQLYRFR